MGISETRMRKLMEGPGPGRPGVAGKVGELVETIRGGGWCEEQGSLMRGLAFGILDPDGERYRLALAHQRECPACRTYILSLRGLAAVLPPVFLPGCSAGGAAAAAPERVPEPGRRGRRAAQAARALARERQAQAGAGRSAVAPVRLRSRRRAVPPAGAGCWPEARWGRSSRLAACWRWASGRVASRSTSAPIMADGGTPRSIGHCRRRAARARRG